MTTSSQNGTQKRNNPFARTTSPNVGSSPAGRPQSAVFSSSPLSAPHSPVHARNQSYSSLGNIMTPTNSSSFPALGNRNRQNSKASASASNTFAPSFIKTEETRRSETIKGIEGENDFSGKRYVWLKDPQVSFIKGWVVEELGNNRMLVQCDDGSVSLFLLSVHQTLTLYIATRSRCR
jgi:myosin protein heavy chain